MSLLRPSRRDILKLAAIAPAFSLPAQAAQLASPQTPNLGHFRFTLGQAKLTILSDGYFTSPASGIGVNADPAEVQAFLTKYFLSPTESYNHANHLFIETPETKVLVDVGSGDRFFDTTGELMANLQAANIDPSTITHVVITHAHPDHLWGIRDDFDEPIFPDAEYIMGEVEHAHWMQDDYVNKVPPENQQFVIGAVNSINTEGVEWTLAKDGHQVAPGVSLVFTPGHTPGHMSVRLESEGQSLIALGDSMSHIHTNFAHPEWYNGFDMDGDQTVATRNKLLDMAVADKIALVGYHFPFPGVGHVIKSGETYQFVPTLWQF